MVLINSDKQIVVWWINGFYCNVGATPNSINQETTIMIKRVCNINGIYLSFSIIDTYFYRITIYLLKVTLH